MSEYDDELETETQPLDPNIRKQLREAEKARKELEQAKAELAAQRREIEFAKAGIPESGLGSLFRKAYDGEASTEAIRKAAEEYGILSPTLSAPVEQGTSPSELEALRRAQGATLGTSGAQPDPGQEFLAALAGADSPEKIMEIVRSQQGQTLGLWSSRSAF